MKILRIIFIRNSVHFARKMDALSLKKGNNETSLPFIIQASILYVSPVSCLKSNCRFLFETSQPFTSKFREETSFQRASVPTRRNRAHASTYVMKTQKVLQFRDIKYAYEFNFCIIPAQC